MPQAHTIDAHTSVSYTAVSSEAKKCFQTRSLSSQWYLSLLYLLLLEQNTRIDTGIEFE